MEDSDSAVLRFKRFCDSAKNKQMNFEYTERSIELQEQVDDFMQRHIFPLGE